MATVLDTVISSSGREYEIRLGRDGVTYCTCPAWRFSKERPRNCKHLDYYFQHKKNAHTHTQEVMPVEDEDPVYQDGCIEQSVEQAVRELKGLK